MSSSSSVARNFLHSARAMSASALDGGGSVSRSEMVVLRAWARTSMARMIVRFLLALGRTRGLRGRTVYMATVPRFLRRTSARATRGALSRLLQLLRL